MRPTFCQMDDIPFVINDGREVLDDAALGLLEGTWTTWLELSLSGSDHCAGEILLLTQCTFLRYECISVIDSSHKTSLTGLKNSFPAVSSLPSIFRHFILVCSGSTNPVCGAIAVAGSSFSSGDDGCLSRLSCRLWPSDGILTAGSLMWGGSSGGTALAGGWGGTVVGEVVDGAAVATMEVVGGAAASATVDGVAMEMVGGAAVAVMADGLVIAVVDGAAVPEMVVIGWWMGWAWRRH